MPKILNLKTAPTFCIIFLLSVIAKSTTAQCIVKKLAKAGETTIETADNYVYKRVGADYNGLSLKVFEIRKNTSSVFGVKLNFSFSNIRRRAGYLNITLANGEIINLKLTLIKAAQTDNKNIHVNSYEAALSKAVIDKLSLVPVVSIEIASRINYNFSETFTVDEALLKQMLQCLKDS